MRTVLAAGLMLALVGCGRSDDAGAAGATDAGQEAAVSAPAGPPGAPARIPFPNCQWEEIRGAGLKVWAQTCNHRTRKSKFVFKASERMMVAVEDVGAGFGAGGPPIVKRFDLGADAAATALLSQLQIPAGASCTFAPAVDFAVPGKQRFILTPAGAAREAYEKAVVGDDVPDPPCGPFGISAAGDRYFETQDAHPGVWIFVELGTEMPAYDPETIAIEGAPD